jgi:hypothetical protein
MANKKSEKRKREESEKTADAYMLLTDTRIYRLTIDRVIEINRAASPATLNANDLQIDRQPKRVRNSVPPKPTSIQRTQPPRNQQSKNSQACPICEAMPGRQRIASEGMIQCDIGECGLWYHDFCIFTVNTKKPRKMLLFSANQGMDNAAFICPKCLDQPEGYTRGVITQEIKSVLGRVASLLSGEEATLSGTLNHHFLRKFLHSILARTCLANPWRVHNGTTAPQQSYHGPETRSMKVSTSLSSAVLFVPWMNAYSTTARKFVM